MDRDGLADFLRRRREHLTPGDVGLAAGSRRRTPGLRREEVAQVTGMSTDYYVRLEQARSSQPSTQMLVALARTLRLSEDERDHLFRLAGHSVPERTGSSTHVSPALLHVLDRIDDCAAFVGSDLGVVLAQNRLGDLLLGDRGQWSGREASTTWRWFADPSERWRTPEADRDRQSRVRVAELRAAWSRRRGAPDVEEIVSGLLERSHEFAALWAEHEVGLRRDDHKTIIHPQIGPIHLDCEILLTADQGQVLVILSAPAGSSDAEKLRLVGVVGEQVLRV